MEPKNNQPKKAKKQVDRSEVARRAWVKRRENHGKTGISEVGHLAITLQLKKNLSKEERLKLETRKKELEKMAVINNEA